MYYEDLLETVVNTKISSIDNKKNTSSANKFDVNYKKIIIYQKFKVSKPSFFFE